jgi:hypothetical protein
LLSTATEQMRSVVSRYRYTKVCMRFPQPTRAQQSGQCQLGPAPFPLGEDRPSARIGLRKAGRLCMRTLYDCKHYASRTSLDSSFHTCSPLSISDHGSVENCQSTKTGVTANVTSRSSRTIGARFWVSFVLDTDGPTILALSSAAGA